MFLKTSDSCSVILNRFISFLKWFHIIHVDSLYHVCVSLFSIMKSYFKLLTHSFDYSWRIRILHFVYVYLCICNNTCFYIYCHYQIPFKNHQNEANFHRFCVSILRKIFFYENYNLLYLIKYNIKITTFKCFVFSTFHNS